jgi:hypothetical protein
MIYLLIIISYLPSPKKKLLFECNFILIITKTNHNHNLVIRHEKVQKSVERDNNAKEEVN